MKRAWFIIAILPFLTAPLLALPLIQGFLPNRGEYPDSVLFWSRLPDCSLWITHSGIWFDYPAGYDHHRRYGTVVFLGFPIPFSTITPTSPLPYRIRIIRNNTVTTTTAYRELRFSNDSTHTQLRLWIDKEQLHYDWLGTIPPVLWQVRGATALRSSDSSLLLQTPYGTIVHDHLKVFALGSRPMPFPTRFALQHNTVMLDPPPLLPAWVDPVVRSTFLGGSQEDEITAIAALPNGLIVAAGSTTSPDLPSHSGSYDSTFAPPSDAFVALFSPNLTLLALTFIGGSGNDRITDLAVREDQLWMIGTTTSLDFPIHHPIQARYGGGQSDAFLCALDTALSSLLFSTYLGGSSTDAGKKLLLWNGKTIALTESLSDDLPTTPRAIFPNLQGATDLYFLVLDTLRQPIWRSYFGGSGSDVVNDALLLGDTLWLIGKTSSVDFPLRTPLQSTLTGPFDAFLAAVDLAHPRLSFATFLGGSSTDYGIALAYGPEGLWLCGVTNSADFPTTPATMDSVYNGGDDIWLALLQLQPQPTLAAATLLGTQGWEQPTDIFALPDSSAFLIGWTSSAQFPTTPDADQPVSAGDLDVVLVHFAPSLSQLRYASYFGGSGRDKPTAALQLPDATMRFLVAGQSASPQLPESHRGGQPAPKAPPDAFLVELRYPLHITFPDTFITRCPGDTVRIRWRATAHLDSFALFLTSTQRQLPMGIVAASDSAFSWTLPERTGLDTAFTVLATSLDGSIIYDRSEGGIIWYAAPTITQDPRSVVVCPGTDVTFETAGSGYPPPERVWERSTDGGKSWIALPYERSFQLFLPSVGPSLHRALFRLRLENACGTAVSAPAQLLLKPAPIISVHPATQEVCTGDSAIFYASAYPFDSVRWQRSFDRGQHWENIPGATEEFLTIHRADTVSPKTLFRAQFFYRDCQRVSRGASIRKIAPPRINRISAPQTVCPGSPIQLFVDAENAYRYRWYRWDAQQQRWQLLYHQENSRLVTTAVGAPGDTLRYRAQLLGECDTLYTDPMLVFLHPYAPLRIQPNLLQFGTLSACRTQTSLTLSITNADTIPHTLTAASETAAYTVLTPLPVTIPPNSTATLTVRFAPRQQGVFHDTLWLFYAPCAYAVPVVVEGNKLQPLISTLREVDFGDHGWCQFPKDTVLHFQNASPTDTLWIQRWELPSPFRLTTDLPPFLAPLQTIAAEVTYAPAAPEISRAQFSIVYRIHQCIDTVTIPLRGGAIAPVLTISSLALDSLSRCIPLIDTTLRILNRTTDTVTLQLQQLPPYVLSAAITPSRIPPKDSAQLHLQFLPPPGIWHDSITVLASPCPETLAVSIRGFRHYDSIAAPQSLTFPEIPIAARWTDTLLLQNVGTTALFWRSATFRRGNLLRVLWTDPLIPDTLYPGESARIGVEFFALDTLYRDTLLLQFDGLCPLTTAITLTGQARAAAIASWSVASLEGAPGDTVVLRIHGQFDPTLQYLQPEFYRLQLRWNATVLAPLDPALWQPPQNGWYRLALDVPYTGAQDTTIAFPLVVGLGDMEYSPLYLDSVIWHFPDGQQYALPQSYQPGKFHLRTYLEGKPQLLNPNPGQLAIRITPNPFTEVATIQLQGIRFPKLVTLRIYSLLGDPVLELPPSALALQYNPRTGAWEGTLQLHRPQLGQSGVFLLRLSEGIWSLVRLLVLQ